MPEGDSVFQACTRLHRALAGAVLERSDFRVPQLATADLSGYTVAQVVPRGKHLLMRFTPPQAGPPPLTLHSHLLMEGRWELYAPGQRFTRPAHTIRVVLSTAQLSAVGFNIAQVRLLPTGEEHTLVGHLGPDLLGADWDAERAVENLRADPQRLIGQALLDQRIMAGIGNIYRSEILFLARLHPLTPLGHVAHPEHVVQLAHRLLTINRDRPRRVTTGQASTREPLWVYGRTGKPCLRCGTRIRSGKLADQGPDTEREYFYCPHCQPAP